MPVALLRVVVFVVCTIMCVIACQAQVTTPTPVPQLFFEDPTTSQRTISQLAIDNAGNVVSFTIQNSIDCGFGICGAVIYSIAPSGSLNWATSGLNYVASRVNQVAIASNNNIFFQDFGLEGVRALSPDGSLLPNWPVSLGAGINTSPSTLLIDPIDQTVLAKGGATSGFEPPSTRTTSFHQDGTPKWAVTLPGGSAGTPGMVLGPNGGLYTFSDHTVLLDRSDGHVVCEFPSAGGNSFVPLVGGDGFAFSYTTTQILRSDPGCVASPIYDWGQGRQGVVMGYDNGIVFAADFSLPGFSQPGRFLAISKDGVFLWANDLFSPLAVPAVVNSLVYIVGIDANAVCCSRQKLFVLDENNGSIVASAEITAICPACTKVAVGPSGVYVGDLSSTRIYKLNGIAVAPQPGVISVSTNTVNATFVISADGKPLFSGSGTNFNQQAAPGTYTITYGHVEGFIEPGPETKELVAGSTISFSGQYQPLLQVGLITIDSNMPNATFSISPIIPDLGTGPYPVAEFIPSGNYIITFNALSGAVAPPPINVTITPGSSSKVTGTFRLLNSPHLSVFPKNLTLSAPQGSPLSTIIVITSGNERVIFNTDNEIFTGNNWMAVAQLTSSTPSVIAVSINTNLTTGDYTGQIVIKSTEAAVNSITIPVNLTITAPIEQSPHLQIICRPLDDDNDPYLLISRIGRHCYFSANDPRSGRNKFTTFSALPTGGILGFDAKLTPFVNADLDSKKEPFIPGGCGTDALESECVDVPILKNQDFDDVISQLHDAVNAGPEGTYDKANNNSNLWVQRRIDKIGLAVNLPNDVITSSADVCRLFPLLLQRLKAAKLPVNISGGIGFLEDIVLGFYGTGECLF